MIDPSSGRRSGITLLELVMALTIIAVAVGVAVPAFLSLGDKDQLTQVSQRVQTLFRLARDSAISSGSAVTVVIDSVSGLVWIDTSPRILLGSRAGLEAPSSLFETPADTLDLALLGGEKILEGLEPGQSIGLPEGVALELPRARSMFTFEPSGAALADTLVLTGAFGTRAVTIDAWTGDVRVY